MSLQFITNSIVDYLTQFDTLQFTNGDISMQLNISTARVSEVLNVLSGACIISRIDRNFIWQRCDIQQAFADFALEIEETGSDNSIFQQTKTVIFNIKHGIPVDKSKRAYDVLAVLKALNLVIRNGKWEFTMTLVKQMIANFSYSQEQDSRIFTLNQLSYDFE